jgi:5-hydroxyisourate hydrolase-like protein (transthyretin family)
MKGHHTTRSGVALLVLLALSVLVTPVAAYPAALPGVAPRAVGVAVVCTGGISGTVTGANNGQLLDGVTVIVQLVGSTFTKNQDTDNNGFYSISGLPAGNYRVRFVPSSSDRDVYLSEYYNNQPDESSASLVAVADGTITPNIDAALDAGATISGTVTGADTQTGLNNVFVYVYDANGALVNLVLTNASGAYTTPALRSGSYRLQFLPFSDDDTYVSEFYNNKLDLASANAVAATAPNNTPNINAALDLGGHISGTVTATVGGAPLDDVRVTLYTSDGQEVTDVSTDSSGTYTTIALRSGSYKLLFDPSDSNSAVTQAYVAEYHLNKLDLATATLVPVAAPNAVTINAALDLGGQFSGKVTATVGATPLEDIDVDIYSLAGQRVGSTSTDANGNYVTPGLRPGSYKLLFDPDGSSVEDTYVFEFYNNKLTLAAATPVAAPAPSTPAMINAALEQGGRISGTATLAGTDLCGQPFDSGNIIVTIYDSGGQIVETTSTDGDGTYSTNALHGGTYSVGFEGPFGDSFGTIFYNQKPDLPSASPVIVTPPNTTPNINAVLTQVRRSFLPLIRR